MSDLERELLHHAAGLRAVARDLLRDPHLAADAAQDAMRRALAQDGLEPGPMGGWLHRTVVNWTRQWKRSERRRLAREARLPQPDAPATPLEASSRREVLREVTDAVLALEEPYQTAIFLRYFEDLPPRKIAQRTGQNLATIKSRLQRGLAMLRAELTRRSRGDGRQWRFALLTTFGLPGTAAAGLTLTTGAWILATQTKLVFAAVVLCAGGILFYGLGQDPALQPTSVDAAATTVAPPTARGDAPQADDAATREAVAAETPRDSWLDHPYEMALDLLVVDWLGMPVKGHTLRIGPTASPLDDAAAETGPDGRVAITWRSRTPEAEIVIGEGRGALRHLRLRSGVATPWTLLTEPQGGGQRITLSVVGNGGNGQPIQLSGVQFLDVNGGGGGGQTMGPGLHPFATFTAASPSPAADAAAGPELSINGIELTGSSFDFSAATFESLGVKLKQPAAEVPAQLLARIAGTVFGEDGKPAAEIPVYLLGHDPQPLQRGKTDAQGQFAFENLAAAEFTVRAGGGSEGLATASVATTTGTTPAPLNLRRESCIRGTALGADHKPVAKATVEWIADDGSWRDSTTTADDGGFVLANLPPKPGSVRLWLPGDDQRLPAAQLPSVLANTPDLELRPAADCAGAIAVRTALPDGITGRVSLRLWNEETGAGTNIPQWRRKDPNPVKNLAAGWYRIDAFHPACGWVDGGRHWVDGKHQTDAGTLTLPAPGGARFHLAAEQLPAPDQRAFEVCRLRGDTDVRQAIARLAPEQDLVLPAGDYALLWKDKSGAVRSHRFHVDGGASTAIDPVH
ncbi:MAG: sigma-70 family RNA polymerase sigma factor [Planctomycetota bacterium]